MPLATNLSQVKRRHLALIRAQKCHQQSQRLALQRHLKVALA